VIELNGVEGSIQLTLTLTLTLTSLGSRLYFLGFVCFAMLVVLQEEAEMQSC